jgi:hypothetical protein
MNDSAPSFVSEIESRDESRVCGLAAFFLERYAWFCAEETSRTVILAGAKVS